MSKKFSEHLTLAHNLWDNILTPGDTVVDATCGNGHDTCYLAQKVLTPEKGFVYGYDIQKQAIINTSQRLQNQGILLKNIKLIQKSHDDFSDIDKEVKLVVYNLGYLPGSDKTVTTLKNTTIKSLKACMQLEVKYISIMCYPGHKEGKQETNSIIEFLSKLSCYQWNICHYQWINREDSPSLIFLKHLE